MCRAVSILYQYEIQTDGVGVKGASRCTPCGSVLRSLRSPRKPCAPSKPSRRGRRGKTRKVAARAHPPPPDRTLNDMEIGGARSRRYVIFHSSRPPRSFRPIVSRLFSSHRDPTRSLAFDIYGLFVEISGLVTVSLVTRIELCDPCAVVSCVTLKHGRFSSVTRW